MMETLMKYLEFFDEHWFITLVLISIVCASASFIQSGILKFVALTKLDRLDKDEREELLEKIFPKRTDDDD